MDIQHLIYFLAVADTLNYTTAAKQCFISRQGMRQAIQSIEQEYGLSLIINEHNRLSLTPAGVLLRTHTQVVLNDFNRLHTAMQEYSTQAETMRIGISRSLIPFYAPELVRRAEAFARHLPKKTAELQVLSTDEIIQRLHEGSLDAGLIIEVRDNVFPSQPPQPPWPRTVLREDAMTILMSISDPLSSKGSLMLDDLSGRTILLMSDPGICFAPLQYALQQNHILVQFQVVPDYYEVGYRILGSDCIAIDREEAVPPAPSQLDRNLSLEDGRFIMSCILLIPEHCSEKMTAFKQYMQRR